MSSLDFVNIVSLFLPRKWELFMHVVLANNNTTWAIDDSLWRRITLQIFNILSRERHPFRHVHNNFMFLHPFPFRQSQLIRLTSPSWSTHELRNYATSTIFSYW